MISVTKKCVMCHKEKPRNAANFYYRNKKRGWFSSWCKECRTSHRTEHVKRELECQRIRRGLKPCRLCETTEKPKGNVYCTECCRKIAAKNKKADKCIYRSRLRKSTPRWADKDAIRKFYKERPDGFHVDHIVPIRGKNVSGLHVEYNLQYLTSDENIKKSNKFNDGNHYSLEYQGRR